MESLETELLSIIKKIKDKQTKKHAKSIKDSKLHLPWENLWGCIFSERLYSHISSQPAPPEDLAEVDDHDFHSQLQKASCIIYNCILPNDKMF